MSLRRAKGLSQLIEGAVEHGSRAVQKVHLGTSSRTFDVLEKVPGVAAPAAVVRVVHDGWTSAVYATIRGVNKVAFTAISAAIDVAEVARRTGDPPSEDAGSAAPPVDQPPGARAQADGRTS